MSHKLRAQHDRDRFYREVEEKTVPIQVYSVPMLLERVALHVKERCKKCGGQFIVVTRGPGVYLRCQDCVWCYHYRLADELVVKP